MRRSWLHESGNRYSPSSRRPRRPALRLQSAHGKNCVRYIHVCGLSGRTETGVAEEEVIITKSAPLAEMPIVQHRYCNLPRMILNATMICSSSNRNPLLSQRTAQAEAAQDLDGGGRPAQLTTVCLLSSVAPDLRGEFRLSLSH